MIATYHRIVLAVLLVAVSVHGDQDGAPVDGAQLPRPKPAGGLFAADLGEVAAYLQAGHRVPHIPCVVSGPPATPDEVQRWGREVQRAVALFRSGPAELRLLIAKAFRPTDGAAARALWEACGVGDVEARHWLAGSCLASDDAGFRRGVWEWVVTKAETRYGSRLLRGLASARVREVVPEEDQDRLLPLLKTLYEDGGDVEVFCQTEDDSAPPAQERSVRAAVVELVPVTAKGAAMIWQLVTTDAARAEGLPMQRLADQWAACSAKGLFDEEALAGAVNGRDFATTWLLGGLGTWIPASAPAQARLWRSVAELALDDEPRVARKGLCFQVWRGTDDSVRHLLEVTDRSGKREVLRERVDDALREAAFAGVSDQRSARQRIQMLREWLAAPTGLP